ncbi:hypothetical protein QEH52_19135 [Coraliomargarita sp. SDUM461003]|uniref:Lipoprotein n=1 Tax=Thalassobacterium maritimum TaxID=3041265 RepID=A0ABU1B1J2_9BACT|nr:hypothetical protein [Coraliomargarita sp. SDUM461003]MDQ8209642.1 hypothetical protein [Coraliomargarita sp. SDUM461003]
MKKSGTLFIFVVTALLFAACNRSETTNLNSTVEQYQHRKGIQKIEVEGHTIKVSFSADLRGEEKKELAYEVLNECTQFGITTLRETAPKGLKDEAFWGFSISRLDEPQEVGPGGTGQSH